VGGWALNTGVTVWRNRARTRAFARAWSAQMDQNELHAKGVDDQWSFNVLMTSEAEHRPKRFPLRRSELDPRVLYTAPGDAVRLMVLPSAVFAGALSWRAAAHTLMLRCTSARLKSPDLTSTAHSSGGKTAFYSHLPEKYGLQPYVIHATFQRYNNNGKRSRFREARAYHLDPPVYYRDGDFLAYDNLVLEFVEAVEKLASAPLTLVREGRDKRIGWWAMPRAAARHARRTPLGPSHKRPTYLAHPCAGAQASAGGDVPAGSIS